MKVSNKLTELIESSLTDNSVQLPWLQSGGTLSMKDILAPVDKKQTLSPSKALSTGRVQAPHIAAAGQFVNGQYVNDSMKGDNSTISAYNKSPREQLLSSIYKVKDANSAGAVVGALAAPVESAAKLLRPDKYFDGVNSDSSLGNAVGSLVGDAVNVAPFVGSAGEMLSKLPGAVKAGGEMMTAASEAVGPYKRLAQRTWQQTSDLPFAKRAENALWSGTTAKSMPGDVTSHSYFGLSPEQARAKMVADKAGAAAGNLHTDYNMSINSSPLMWGESSRPNANWKIVRPGTNQEVNSTGFLGKRVEQAIPQEVREGHTDYTNTWKGNVAKVDDAYKRGDISLETYNKGKADLNMRHPHLGMLNDMMNDNLAGGGQYRQFLDNYKPTMDSGINAVNAKTGLNFPLTQITNEDAYVQPTIMAINKPMDRLKRVGGDILTTAKANYKVNGLQQVDGANSMYDQLKGSLSKSMLDPQTIQSRINYVKQNAAASMNGMTMEEMDYLAEHGAGVDTDIDHSSSPTVNDTDYQAASYTPTMQSMLRNARAENQSRARQVIDISHQLDGVSYNSDEYNRLVQRLRDLNPATLPSTANEPTSLLRARATPTTPLTVNQLNRLPAPW